MENTLATLSNVKIIVLELCMTPPKTADFTFVFGSFLDQSLLLKLDRPRRGHREREHIHSGMLY